MCECVRERAKPTTFFLMVLLSPPPAGVYNIGHLFLAPSPMSPPRADGVLGGGNIQACAS